MLRIRLREARQLLRADTDRYLHYSRLDTGRALTGRMARAEMLVLREGLLATACYRFGHALAAEQDAQRSRLGRAGMSGLLAGYALLQRVSVPMTGVFIHREATIGPGLYVSHVGGTIIMGTIGANCNISQGATIGRGGSDDPDWPVLGDRVWVGPNAVIVGGVHLGDDAAVGANAVVLRDVPPHTTVGGVPAKVISQKGSVGMVDYPGRGAECRTNDRPRNA
jgi:serine O-acetyltransferase